MKRSSKKQRGLMHPLTGLVLMIAVIGTFGYYYSRLEQDARKLRTLFYEYWQIEYWFANRDTLLTQQQRATIANIDKLLTQLERATSTFVYYYSRLEQDARKPRTLFYEYWQIEYWFEILDTLLTQLQRAIIEILDTLLTQLQRAINVIRYVKCDYPERKWLNVSESLLKRQHRQQSIEIMGYLHRSSLASFDLTKIESLEGYRGSSQFTEGFSRCTISITRDVATEWTYPLVGSTEFGWKLGMDLQIRDVYRFEDYICLISITGRRKLLFRKLLQETIIPIICCCCFIIITRLFLASKMYDVLLNVRKTKEIENKQDDFNNSKEKRVIQHDNGNFSNQTNEMKMNPDNESCKSSVLKHNEQEVNESDVIRAKKHGILEREKPRLEHLVMCKICLDADASVVFLPCSHMVACRNCAKNLQRCPVCRAIIDEFLQVNQT